MASLPDITKLDTWIASPLGQAAKSMSDAFLFPCHGITDELKCTCGDSNCGSPGKHPYTKHGVNDAVNNIVSLAQLFDYRTDLNLGMSCGKISGIFVIDIDGNKGGWDSLEKLENTYGSLPDAPTSITGNGEHRFFSMPEDFIKNKAKALGKDYPGIDTRTNGGYIIVPPSRHYSGRYYTWKENSVENTPDLPSWLMVMLKEGPKVAKKIIDNKSRRISEWTEEDVLSMLSFLDPDAGSYDDWLHIGMALHEGGFPASFWDDWSQKGPRYTPKCCENRWRSFKSDGEITMGTLVDRALAHGFLPSIKEYPPVDTSIVDTIVEKIQRGKIREMPKFKFSFDPLKIDGLIGDTVRWITKHALYKQPELALLNVLAFAGAIFGRQYASPLNTRTNLYIVGIAGTGQGKDFSRQCICELAKASGLDGFLGANYIRSDIGLLMELHENPCQLMMIDEYGMYLDAMSNPRAPTHFRNVAQVVTKLYTSSNTGYNHGKTGDPTKKSLNIVQPGLCIYGTTTEKKYVKALSGDSIESGEINRFICYKSTAIVTGKERNPETLKMDDEVASGWEKFSVGKNLGAILSSSDVGVDPKIIPWDEECENLQYYYNEKQVEMLKGGGKTGELWVRLRENTIKIAMVLAVCRDSENPKFIPEDLEIGYNIVETCIRYMCYLAEDHMAESIYESDQQRIKSYISNRGYIGATLTDINQAFRAIKAKDRRDILTDLDSQGKLIIEYQRGTNKTIPIYRIK